MNSIGLSVLFAVEENQHAVLQGFLLQKEKRFRFHRVIDARLKPKRFRLVTVFPAPKPDCRAKYGGLAFVTA